MKTTDSNADSWDDSASHSDPIVAELVPPGASIARSIDLEREGLSVTKDLQSAANSRSELGTQDIPVATLVPRSNSILYAEPVEAIAIEAQANEIQPKSPAPWRSVRWWIRLPIRIAYGLFQFASLIVLLAIASSVPLLQLAGLGYMLEVGRRIADRKRGEKILPGLEQATRIGVLASGAFLTWLPVWMISNNAYDAELMEAGSVLSQRWHAVAWIATLFWLLHVSWSALRGGRWYHFLWPAPIRFFREVWRPATWRKVEDGLWQYTVGLKLPKLMWLGFRGAIGAIAWLIIPAAMMTIGLRANEQPVRFLIGILGSMLMMVVLTYLPFLQIQMARENRLRAIFDVKSVRADFKRAPWAFAVSFVLTLAAALPLYLLRIEPPPAELIWLPCIFFVLLTLPTRMLVGWAMQRGHRDIPRRFWLSRYIAWTLQWAALPFYMLALYLGTITSWDGAAIFVIQHAFLVPVPFSGT